MTFICGGLCLLAGWSVCFVIRTRACHRYLREPEFRKVVSLFSDRDEMDMKIVEVSEGSQNF